MFDKDLALFVNSFLLFKNMVKLLIERTITTQ